MAHHAELHARNRRFGPCVHSDMAIGAMHSAGKMGLVRKSDRLDGLGSEVEKVPQSIENRSVRGCENLGGS